MLPAEQVEALLRSLEQGLGGSHMAVDLEAQRITTPEGGELAFSVDPSRRAALLAGLDEIGMTLSQREAIDAFQQHDRLIRPWIYEPPLTRPPGHQGSAKS